MLRPIIYKEWVKTRWAVIVIGLVLLGFVAWSLLNMHRVVELKGAAHVWEVMLSRDAVFVDMQKYVPLLAGVALALFQYLPEMYHKCLKLTLHLPFSEFRLVGAMQIYGMALLLLFTALSFLGMYLYLSHLLVPELCMRVLQTALPWYLAGWAAYLLLAWICLEPSWKRRLFYMAFSGLLLKIYFFYPGSQAYNSFLPALTVLTLLLSLLTGMSVARFKSGKQD